MSYAQPPMAAVLGGADAISAINTIKNVTLGEGSEVNGCQVARICPALMK